MRPIRGAQHWQEGARVQIDTPADVESIVPIPPRRLTIMHSPPLIPALLNRHPIRPRRPCRQCRTNERLDAREGLVLAIAVSTHPSDTGMLDMPKKNLWR